MNLVMIGDENAGRTSIAKILFQKFVTKQTMILTQTLTTESYDFKIHELDFTLHDFPSKLDFLDIECCQRKTLHYSQALIYVLNAKEECTLSLSPFFLIYRYIRKNLSENYPIFIFINKADIDFASPDVREQFVVKLKQLFFDNEMKLQKVNFFFTSILDYSIYEAFSQVIQQILPCTNHLNKLLNITAKLSKMEKIFVYDIVTKLVIAHNDEAHLVEEVYEIYSDIVDFYINLNINLAFQSQETGENEKNQRIQVKLAINQKGDKKVIRFQQVEHSLVVCFLINEINFDRPFLVDRNIETFGRALIKYLQITAEYLKQ